METGTYAESKHAVLITGGSDGIGLGLAERYLRRGDRVLVTGRREDRLRAAADRVPGLETVVSDAGDPDARAALAAHVARVMPELDTVVQNAGVQRRVPIAEDDGPWSDAQREVEILLGGPVHLNRLLVPVLLAHGRPALIVDVTSGGAYAPQPFAPLYSALKAAVHSWTTNLRHALEPTPIRVTELIPPAVATGLAGAGQRHGADLDEFCDAVLPGLLRAERLVGFGATASEPFRAVIDASDALFATTADRVRVRRFAEQADVA